MTEELSKKEIKKAISIGAVSCVGYIEMTFPAHRGNYFNLITENGNGYEIANFWYEDFQYLLDSNQIKFPINIKILESKWAIIYDPQVPEHFYSETSYRAPEKYWSVTQQAKRQLKIDTGEIVISNGLESRFIKCDRKTLNVKWTSEATKDLKTIINTKILNNE
jgi:hypothetical protein